MGSTNFGWRRPMRTNWADLDRTWCGFNPSTSLVGCAPPHMLNQAAAPRTTQHTASARASVPHTCWTKLPHEEQHNTPHPQATLAHKRTAFSESLPANESEAATMPPPRATSVCTNCAKRHAPDNRQHTGAVPSVVLQPAAHAPIVFPMRWVSKLANRHARIAPTLSEMPGATQETSECHMARPILRRCAPT